MLLTFRDLTKIFVFIEGENKPVGQLMDCVVNRSNGIFEAFWVQTNQKTKLLQPSDIVRWEKRILYIKNTEKLLDPEKALRLKPFLEQDVSLLRSPVWNGKTLLGLVENFSFDTISPRLLHVYSKKGWWMFARHFIVHVSQIEQITSKGIYLRQNIPKNKIKKEPSAKKASKLTEKQPARNISGK